MRISSLLMTVLAVGLVLGTADTGWAKDKNGKAKGKNVQVDKKPGKGAKSVPPGQIKRYTRGAKLPADLKYEGIGDLSKWKLGEPGKGNRYIKVDNEILEVSEDLSTVVDAVGIVGDLLK